jgi:hypothetical protein
MLHPLKPPSCESELEALISLQQKTLEFASANNNYSETAFRAAVGNGFVNWLLDFKSPGVQTPKPVNRFFQELNIYLKCSTPEKTQILQDFINDQRYYKEISKSSFSFSLLPKRSDAHSKAGHCLVLFYDFLGIGYPPALVGHSVGSAVFKKESVIDGCKDKNPDVEYVCPCCDNAFTDSANANEQGYTLEHYFPRSLYPSICLHSFNLIPMCSGCNSRKGDFDPLNPSLAPLILVGYEEVFHPIARPVRYLAHLSFQPRTSVPDEMQFVSSNPPPTYENSIAAYKMLYKIPDRWEKNWKRVDKQINSYVLRALRRINPGSINQISFDAVLQEAILDLEGDVGQQHLCYPAAKWLSWARTHKFQDLMQAFMPS